jgi:hypothetical protein
VAQAIEHLPDKCEALRSNSIPPVKKRSMREANHLTQVITRRDRAAYPDDPGSSHSPLLLPCWYSQKQLDRLQIWTAMTVPWPLNSEAF